MAERPVFSFDYHPSVAEFAVSKRSYLAARPGASFSYIATSTLVLDTRIASNPRVLLLQRAASDEDPNKWEPPGGACDDDDESILHAAARELWEEADLQAARIGGPVGDPCFITLSDGKKVLPVVQIEAFLPANLMPAPFNRRGRLTRRLLAVEVPGKQRPGTRLDGVDLHTMSLKHEMICLNDLELRGRIAVGAVWADRLCQDDTFGPSPVGHPRWQPMIVPEPVF